MKQLVKFEKEWADEFTVECFTVLDHSETETFFSVAEIFFDLKKTMSCGFGSNQQLEFENYKSFRNCFEVINLTDEEAIVFQKYFSNKFSPESPPEFGTGSGIFDFNNFYEDFFELHDEGLLSENVIEKLKQLEPEFESWLNMVTTN
jgi:hypothetical protein